MVRRWHVDNLSFPCVTCHRYVTCHPSIARGRDERARALPYYGSTWVGYTVSGRPCLPITIGSDSVSDVAVKGETWGTWGTWDVMAV